MTVDLMIWAILLAAPVSLFGVLCAINRMHISTTQRPIMVGFVLCAWGWGALIFAALDYLVHAAPMVWPQVLLGGVLCLAVGNSVIYLGKRRRHCADCANRPRPVVWEGCRHDHP